LSTQNNPFYNIITQVNKNFKVPENIKQTLENSELFIIACSSQTLDFLNSLNNFKKTDLIVKIGNYFYLFYSCPEKLDEDRWEIKTKLNDKEIELFFLNKNHIISSKLLENEIKVYQSEKISKITFFEIIALKYEILSYVKKTENNEEKRQEGDLPWYLRKAKTAKEIIMMKLPEPCWLIENLLPEGLTLLAGRPKVGKSWLALNFALELVKKGYKVLYLALEDNPKRIKKRLETLKAPLTDNLLFEFDIPKLDFNTIITFRDKIIKEEIKVVIIDTFVKIKPNKEWEEPYSANYQIFSKIKKEIVDKGISIILIHHLRKAQSLDPLDQVLGSTSYTAAVDNILILKRARGLADATLYLVCRDYEEKEWALRFDNGFWYVLGDSPKYTISQERRQIWETIQNLGGKATPKEVATLLGKSYSAVKKLMFIMEKEGLLISKERGKYSLPTQN